MAAEAARLGHVWAARAARIRHRLEQLVVEEGDWAAEDFARELDGLEAEIVSLDAYRDAVNAGRRTFPGTHRDDEDPAVAKWTGHVTEYAVKVPGRIADDLAAAANAAQAMDGATAQDVVDALHAKLDALESSVTRYAGPLWGAGQEGYGRQLDQHDVLLVWVIDSANPCGDCENFADGSPYTADELPAWPGDGTSECKDHCQCTIIADPETWDPAFDQAA